MLKEIIKEELADALAEETKQPPAQPKEAALNSDIDETPKETTDTPKQGTQTPKTDSEDKFNVELFRDTIKKEIRDIAADMLNKQPAAQPEPNARTVDEVYASLLGIDITK